MNKLIILKYMERLTRDDIIKYANKQDINIKDNELDLIYAYIKKYPERILNDAVDVIDEIKDDLSLEVYNKLLELYDKYKNKIS